MFRKSGVEIWPRGYVCSFRRRVVRLWAQMAYRFSSQSGKHYPQKPKCFWKDANRWTSSRHCVPVTCPSRSTERYCCCTCCRKHGRWSPKYLNCILYSISLPKANYFLVVPPEDCRGNTVGLEGAQEKSMKQEGRGQGTTFERMT